MTMDEAIEQLNYIYNVVIPDLIEQGEDVSQILIELFKEREHVTVTAA